MSLSAKMSHFDFNVAMANVKYQKWTGQFALDKQRMMFVQALV